MILSVVTICFLFEEVKSITTALFYNFQLPLVGGKITRFRVIEYVTFSLLTFRFGGWQVLGIILLRG
jgi:hypothetical protein